MGIEPKTLCSKFVSSSDVAQNDKRSARNIMVLARMPEDRSKTFKIDCVLMLLGFNNKLKH
eukprot:4413070-Heterocapsa_arctica.AAC.1